MIFAEKEITLKNGTVAVLRSPCAGEGGKMLKYIRQACGETDFLLRRPEEWGSVTVESEEKWISGGLESDSILRIACFIGDEVAGNCEVMFNNWQKTSHRAVFMIAILKKYWGLGIGTAMFGELIAVAKARPGVRIAELEVFEGNDRALALYEKFGFNVVCERPNAFMRHDGSYAKELFMQKML